MAKVEVQAIQVGPAVFLSNPGEFFCQLGLDIKAGSGFPFTFVVELANDCVGYVPTEEALGPSGGGYETRLTSYSNLEVTGGTQIVKGCIDLARQLKPGPVPERPRAPRGPSRGNTAMCRRRRSELSIANCQLTIEDDSICSRGNTTLLQ